MENSNSQEEVTYKSGNMFGWRFSFISLGIILVTLVAVILTESHKKQLQPKETSIKVDSIEVEQVDSLMIKN